MTDGPRRSFCHNADGTPKFTFMEKRDAKKVARLVSSLPGYQVEGRAMHLYKCPSSPTGCGMYHLGHQDWTPDDAA